MMKHFILFLVLSISVLSGSAQEFKWDVNAGYLHVTSRLSVDYSEINIYTPDDPFLIGEFTSTETANGYYLGLGGQYRLEGAMAISGSLNYARYTESNFLQIPLALHYYIAESGFNILAGPQFTYNLEDLGPFNDDINKLNIGAGAGLGYDFTKSLFLEARYTFQLNRYFKSDNTPEIRTNYLNIGLGYRF
ncbi:hypothetical protein CJ305_13010 [Leeuwenhoekiella nanhaiensis]|uniref:Outer membrane protein beta-barrel domain-containing protein n=2 Tax=Leeuwenhoekiella nanhaiensis TaxID=1655491 RepID=A0A2G1VPR2_9FLAO|nr:hypothetical protein CJ305_13010 [Leeuwenhoekiella nanhaiensis]